MTRFYNVFVTYGSTMSKIRLPLLNRAEEVIKIGIIWTLVTGWVAHSLFYPVGTEPMWNVNVNVLQFLSQSH